MIDPDIAVEAAKIEKTAEKGDAKAATATDLSGTTRARADGAVRSTCDHGTPADYQLTRAVDMLRGIALFNGRVVT